MCKIIFTAPFYSVGSQAALLPQLLHRGAIKVAWSLLCNLHLPARSLAIPLPPSLRLKRKRRIEN
jgi:hypothetical protein